MKVWIIVLAVLCTSRTVAQVLVITPKGDIVKTHNADLVLSCTLTEVEGHLPDPGMKWMGPDKTWITATAGRVHVEKDSSQVLKLFIDDMTKADTGEYSCAAVVGGRPVHTKTRLLYFEEITFINSPTLQQYRLGSSPVIKCQARGQPEPTMSWRFQRRKIPQEGDKYKYVETGLRINNLELSDNGTYECRAEVSTQGMLKIQRIALDILYPPIIEQGPIDTAAVRGSDAVMTCKASGNPPVTYQWFKEKKFSDMIKWKSRIHDGDDTLVIKNVDKDDEGRYFCKVINDYGYKQAYADLTVHVPPVVKKLPHRVQLVNEVMVLPCEAMGVPRPTISWRKVGASESFDENENLDFRVSVDTSNLGISKLIIRDIKAEDAGKYTCSAVSSAGKDEKNATLTVEYRPSILPTLTEAYGWPGETRNFTCNVTGMPQPAVRWFRKTEYLGNNKTYTITNEGNTSTLVVRLSENTNWAYGAYSCFVKNRHGDTTKTYYLQQARKPDTPRDVTVARETYNTVTLRTGRPKKTGGLPITSWKVKYTSSANASVSKTFLFKDGDIMKVNGLKAGNDYTFLVSAGNLIGYSRPARFKVRTPRKAVRRPHGTIVNVRTNVRGTNYTLVGGRPHGNATVRKTRIDDDVAGVSVAAVVGVLIGIILLLIVIIIVSIWYRKKVKRGDYYFSVAALFKGSKEPRVKTVAIEDKDLERGLQIEMQRKNSPLPDIVDGRRQENGKVGNGVLRTMSPRLPHPLRENGQTRQGNQPNRDSATENISKTLNCIAQNTNTTQRNAWHQMLKSQEFEQPDVELKQAPDVINDDDSPIGELPPPPPFLLDSYNPGLYRDANGCNGNVYTDAPNGETGMYNDLLDGYHSEDNLEQDDDAYALRYNNLYIKYPQEDDRGHFSS